MTNARKQNTGFRQMRPRSRCPACPRKTGTTAETISERNTSSSQKYTFSHSGAREISIEIEAALALPGRINRPERQPSMPPFAASQLLRSLRLLHNCQLTVLVYAPQVPHGERISPGRRCAGASVGAPNPRTLTFRFASSFWKDTSDGGVNYPFK